MKIIKLFISLTCTLYLVSGSSLREPKPTKLSEDEIRQMCLELDCVRTPPRPVCGIKNVENEFEYKIFENECLLLLNGCGMKNFSNAYGLTDLSKCQDEEITKYMRDPPDEILENKRVEKQTDRKNGASNNTSSEGKNVFDSTKEISNNGKVVNDVTKQESDEIEFRKKYNSDLSSQNIYVVDSSGFDIDPLNYDAYINDFFNSTHYKNYTVSNTYSMDDQIKEYKDINLEDYEDPYLNGEIWSAEPSIRRAFKVQSIPNKPLLKFSKDVPGPEAGGFHNIETFHTCYHKCPKKCPDFYVPVCGAPGYGVKEPRLTYKNHCLMDIAQCKTYRVIAEKNKKLEKKKRSYITGYMENNFLFCLGDSMGGLLRFLPMLRSLQKMGRIRPKGVFHHRVRNFKYFNPRMPIGYKPMG